MLSDYRQLLRMHQWIKNLFVFAPLFFGGMLFDGPMLLQSLVAFASFCFISSSVYIMNDYKDADLDRLHPKKKNRPIARGVIAPKGALLVGVMIFMTGMALATTISSPFIAIVSGYALMNIAYSFWLKHMALYDIIIIALGFVLRVFAGSVSTGIPLSSWVVIITFLLALFLAFAKRREDCGIYEKTGEERRASIAGYSLNFVDTSMAIVASVTMVSYILYAVEASANGSNEYLYLTSFFVLIGLLRYLQIAFVEGGAGEPTKVVTRDRHLMVQVGMFVMSFGYLLYA